MPRVGDDRLSGAMSTSYRLVCAVAIAVLVAAGCSGDEGDASPSGTSGTDADVADDAIDGVVAELYEEPFHLDAEPEYGGRVVVGVESDTPTYAPDRFQGTQAAVNVALAIYDPLMRLGADGEYHPFLAESLDANADYTVWTLKLRPGVVFHDGTALDAEAIKSNFDEYLTRDGARTVGDLEDVSAVEVVDDLTVRYLMRQANASLPSILAGSQGWPFSPTAASALGDDFGSNPVGTGPFRLVSWDRDAGIVLERNPDYWQEGLPYLDELEVRPIPDETARLLAYEAGDIDAFHSVRLSELLASALRLPETNVYMGRTNSASGAIFQTQNPPVDDPRIRQALSWALDQQTLVEVVAGDAAPVTELYTQYYASSSPYYSEAVAEAWPTDDPDRARELLESYVNDPDRSDGRPVGEPVEIIFNYVAVQSLATLAQLYGSMWEDVGFEVELEAVEQATNIEKAISGEYIASVTRQGGGNDPYIGLSNHFGDPAVTPANYMKFEHPRVTEILDELRTTSDVEARQELLEEFGLLMAEQVPNTWTGSNNEFIAARSSIAGIHSWTMPDGETLGSGAYGGSTTWAQVWRIEP